MDCARLTRLSGRLGGPVSFGRRNWDQNAFRRIGGQKRSAGFGATGLATPPQGSPTAGQCRWLVDGNGAEAYAEAGRREREGPAVTWLGVLHSNYD
ncbi:MAG: hypothetical protein WAV18_16040 [Roseiarcus sp.]